MRVEIKDLIVFSALPPRSAKFEHCVLPSRSDLFYTNQEWEEQYDFFVSVPNEELLLFQVFDITRDNVSSLGTFGVVHDKGTYDAISLHPEDPKAHREKYIDQVAAMLDEMGDY